MIEQSSTPRRNFMDKQDRSRLKRSQYKMPDFVRDALIEFDLMDVYRQRPPYQQNDYIGWITRAKRTETQQKRLAQILRELEDGDKYMKMAYRAKK
jgi:uncharacterized protein YdeI (YjbR/CyaY-like superfamily)